MADVEDGEQMDLNYPFPPQVAVPEYPLPPQVAVPEYPLPPQVAVPAYPLPPQVAVPTYPLPPQVAVPEPEPLRYVAMPEELSVQDMKDQMTAMAKLTEEDRTKKKNSWQDLRDDPYSRYVVTVCGLLERGTLERMYRSDARADVLTRPKLRQVRREFEFLSKDAELQAAIGRLPEEGDRERLRDSLKYAANAEIVARKFLRREDTDVARVFGWLGATFQRDAEKDLHTLLRLVPDSIREINRYDPTGAMETEMEIDSGTLPALDSAMIDQVFREFFQHESLKKPWQDAMFEYARSRVDGVKDPHEVDWSKIDFEKDYCALLTPPIVAATSRAYEYFQSLHPRTGLASLNDMVIKWEEDRERFSAFTGLVAAIISESTGALTTTAFTMTKRQLLNHALQTRMAAARRWAGVRPASPPRRRSRALFG